MKEEQKCQTKRKLGVHTAATSMSYRGRCKYKSGRCKNERTIKENGQPHTLCEPHRIQHNKNQRKSDIKRRRMKKLLKAQEENARENNNITQMIATGPEIKQGTMYSNIPPMRSAGQEVKQEMMYHSERPRSLSFTMPSLKNMQLHTP